MSSSSFVIGGVVLAGGRSGRMGGHPKGLLHLAGQPLVARVLQRLIPQVERAVLSVQDDHHRSLYEALTRAAGCGAILDELVGFLGPLAGIHAAMGWVRHHCPMASHVLSVPVDCPFLPLDLAARLYAALPRTANGTLLPDGSLRTHPIIALWPLALRPTLEQAMLDAGMRRVAAFAAAHPLGYADYPAEAAPAFFNINTPSDLAAAALIAPLAKLGAAPE
jgi:molybdenum cofactor guanylyltransferase